MAIPDGLQAASSWAQALAYCSVPIYTAYRLVVKPRLVKPALAFVDRVDETARKVDDICRALGKNGGRSLGDLIENTNRLAQRTHELAVATDGRTAVLANESQVALFECNGNGDNLFANAQFQRTFGYPPAELTGKKWKRILHPEDRDRLEHAYRQSINDGHGCDLIGRFVTATGTVLHMRLSIQPWNDETTNQAIRWYGRLEPVTIAPKAEASPA